VIWILFPILLIIDVLIIYFSDNIAVAVGYSSVIAWIILLLYVIFYKKDSFDELIKSVNQERSK